VLDAHGKIAWGRSDIGGDPIVAVLTERVSDAHLAGLRRDGVSYIFAGERDLALGLALEILNRELGVKRLLVEGGGANGAYLRAGLIDEISLVICPAVDGAKGAPSVFSSGDEDAGAPAPVRSHPRKQADAQSAVSLPITTRVGGPNRLLPRPGALKLAAFPSSQGAFGRIAMCRTPIRRQRRLGSDKSDGAA
jgi:hypothetical protein